MKKKKAIRVGAICYEHRRGNYWKQNELPYIRLGGEWLKDRGFEVGEILEVMESKNCIILYKADKKKLEKHNIKKKIKDHEFMIAELTEKYERL